MPPDSCEVGSALSVSLLQKASALSCLFFQGSRFFQASWVTESQGECTIRAFHMWCLSTTRFQASRVFSTFFDLGTTEQRSRQNDANMRF